MGGGSYPSAEVQAVNSTPSADWVNKKETEKKEREIYIYTYIYIYINI